MVGIEQIIEVPFDHRRWHL